MTITSEITATIPLKEKTAMISHSGLDHHVYSRAPPSSYCSTLSSIPSFRDSEAHLILNQMSSGSDYKVAMGDLLGLRVAEHSIHSGTSFHARKSSTRTRKLDFGTEGLGFRYPESVVKP